MKKVLMLILGIIVLLSGILLAAYPFLSNFLMEQNNASEITTQKNAVEKTDSDKLKAAYDDAVQYNKNLLGKVVLTDPFDPNITVENDVEYSTLLNLNGDGIMGSIEIPKINVKLPVYHGTNADVLEKGVGHMTKTSLPIGGKSTHSVLTGHTGLSSARLFTDIDKLTAGDVFFINVLDKKLAYKVVKTEVVLPSETEDLRVVQNKDYVTLVTCTPYGKNTHRLFVRGERTDYNEAEKSVQNIQPTETTWMQQYKYALFVALIIVTVILIVFYILRTVLSKRKKNTNKEVSLK